ncbi:tetratricopeptide repeat protein [Microcoleus sp. Pol10_D6]|uniref:CHAT domain-containing protein n=1 Tax=Microcoleus sp. Pol10_D6 TaxID=2818875 RepID=UPI002FD08F9C
MDENRTQAYINLIESLLSCPSDEKSQILKANWELLDLGFLQVCEGVAARLAEEGEDNIANFLRSLASQLGGLLGLTSAGGNDVANNSPEDYVVFLKLLLQTELDNFGGDSRHIYGVLQANLDKLNLNFIPVIKQTMVKILVRIDNPEKAEEIAALIGNIAVRIQEFPIGSRADNLEIAIAAYEIVLSVRTLETNPEKWAHTQNNLANSYLYKIRGARADNLDQAIAFYTAALQVYTRDAFPEDWAMTQNNLAAAYSERIRGEKADNVEQAIAFYTAALQVYTRDAFPERWAMTHNNLAAAYSNRIRGEKADNLEQAIAFYKVALEVYTRDAFPERWAMTHNNLALAYSGRIREEKADNVEQAIAFYKVALEVYTREAFPQDWATTQNNLALAYSDRIKGERADNLEQAILSCTAALKVYTCDAFPERWAMTQNNLANAYRVRIRGEKADNVEQAIAFYTAALQVYTRDAFPERWATTQNNLALAYSDRIREEKADNVEQAIAFYKVALEVYTREAFPENWATTQNNLAAAYYERIRGERADNLEQAIAFYTAALQVYTRNAFPQDWAMTESNMGVAYSDRIKGKRADNIEQAILSYTVALQVYTRDVFPEYYAKTLFNLGLAYRDVPNLQLAHNTFAAAINTVESLRSDIHSGDETKKKLAEEWNKLYRNMVEVCIELNNYTEAIEYVERSKARNLVELLANKDIYPKLDLYPNSEIYPTHCYQLEQLRREIPAQQRELEILISSQESEEKYRDEIKRRRQELNQLQQQRDELLSEINKIDSSFIFTQKVKSIPFSDIQSLTDENTAIVEWYITGSQILTFIITCHHPHPIVVSSSFEDMTALTNWDIDYRDLYHKPKNEWINNLASRLQNLAQILHIDDIISSIDDCFSKSGAKCNRLILTPHRYLHLFPLHALPLADGKLLFERFSKAVGYAPSCQLLKHAKDQEQNRPDFTRLFAIQNPTRKTPGPLLGSQLEIDKICQHFDPQHSIILKEAEATEANFYRSMEQIRSSHCLHFSCHGQFNFESPLKSALLFTDPEDKLGEEGKLTLGEVFEKLYLNQCRLVTFSACESGLTDPNSISDEYIGLPSGFLYAGSLSIVSTLWTVDPIATTLLMVKFYHNLKRLTPIKTGDVAIALNQAQKWLRTLTNKKLARIKNHPKFQLQLEQAFESQEEDLKLFNLLLNQAILTKKTDRQPYPFANPYYWSAFVAIGL